MLMNFDKLGAWRWILGGIATLMALFLLLPILFIVALSFGSSRWLTVTLSLDGIALESLSDVPGSKCIQGFFIPVHRFVFQPVEPLSALTV